MDTVHKICKESYDIIEIASGYDNWQVIKLTDKQIEQFRKIKSRLNQLSTGQSYVYYYDGLFYIENINHPLSGTFTCIGYNSNTLEHLNDIVFHDNCIEIGIQFSNLKLKSVNLNNVYGAYQQDLNQSTNLMIYPSSYNEYNTSALFLSCQIGKLYREPEVSTLGAYRFLFNSGASIQNSKIGYLDTKNISLLKGAILGTTIHTLEIDKDYFDYMVWIDRVGRVGDRSKESFAGNKSQALYPYTTKEVLYSYLQSPSNSISIQNHLERFDSNNYIIFDAKSLLNNVQVHQRVVHNCLFSNTKIGEIKLYSVEEIQGGSFAASSISSLNMGNNLKIIGCNAFISSKIHDITFSNRLEEIRERAFKDVNILGNLCCIYLPNIKHIEKEAFYNMQFSGNITLGRNLRDIGDYAFYNVQIDTLEIGSPVNIGKEVFKKNRIKKMKILSTLGNLETDSFQTDGLGRIQQYSSDPSTSPNTEIELYITDKIKGDPNLDKILAATRGSLKIYII